MKTKYIAKNIIALISILTLTIITSCKKDFLNVTDPNVFSESNFPRNVEDLNVQLNDLYGRLRNGIYNPDVFRFLGFSRDRSADQAYLAPEFTLASQFGYDKTHGIVGDLWSQHYENIAKCVGTLQDIERFKSKNPNLSVADLEKIDYIEGQVLFLRAWNYMILVNFYGEVMIASPADKEKMGVPIITKLAKNINDTQIPRSSVGQVWSYIIDDLKKSEILLKTKTWDNSNISRVSAWAVKSFLGKAYIYTQDWALASEKLKEVIDGSGKTLVSFEIYKNMFNGSNEFNSESLFELDFSRDRPTDYNVITSVGQRLSMYLGPYYSLNKANSDIAVRHGYGNFFIHNKNLIRFGFPGLAVTPAQQSARAYLTQSKTWRDTKVTDPRLWVVAFQPYLDSLKKGNEFRATLKNTGEGVNTDDLPAWCFRKHVLTSIDENFVSNGINMQLIRLADIYLLYAEALVNTGQNTLALEYINKVKRRAYNQANINAPSRNDYANLNALTKSPDPVLKNDPLKYERWAETFAEGTWWFDVCRWRLGQSENDFFEKVTTGPLTWSDNKYALPIPLSELNTNKAMKQNPGYN